MHIQRMALRLALALAPSSALSELLTVTRYASTCSASHPANTAIYTSGSNTFTLPASTSATPAPRVALCPDYNGQNYSSPASGTYGVHCDLAITGTRLSGLQARQANIDGQISQQGCIAVCQQSDACVALTVRLDSCEYFSNVTGTVDAIGSAALIKLDASDPVSTITSYSTPSGISQVERTVVSTMIISIPYTTTVISQQTTTAISTSISLVPTTIVSSYIGTATSLVPTTVERTVTATAISTVPTTIVSTSIRFSTSTLVTTVDQTRFVTSTTAIPTTVVSSYVSTAYETVYFPSITTATTELISTIFFPSTVITTSLIPTTLVVTTVSSYPVTETLVQTTTSLLPTTLVTTYVSTATATATATETSISTFDLTATETTLEVSTAVSTQKVTATPTVITLPNNLGTQFGGVDVTKGFRNPNFVRPGLWNLGTLDGSAYETHTVYYGTNDQWTYQVPEFLAFSWASQLNTETVTGETKRDYQRKLSSTLSANIGFAGFGLEIQDTFEEEDLVETYYKYASIYSRQQIYRVSTREYPSALQGYLSDRARKLFAAGDAKAIVDTFGTHYMTSASFGGMRRFASSLDVRDETISTKLGQALKTKFAAETEAGEVSGGASSGSTDETVTKIRNSMDVKSSIVFGGTYVDGRDDWIPSLYRNPSAIDFELASIADLILDAKIKSDVQNEIESRIKISQVTSTALALVMWETLGDLRTDKGSGARASLSTATVNRRQGWFTMGQYGLGAYGWDPSRSKGLLIRNIPGSTAQWVKQPDGYANAWGKSDHYGLYEMTSSDPKYYALSSMYYSDNKVPFSTLEADRVGMVHVDMTLPASDGGELWTDGGSGAQRDAFVHRISYGAPDDDSIRILQLDIGQPEAYFFHTNDYYMSPPRRLDFSKVQFVSNNFINPA